MDSKLDALRGWFRDAGSAVVAYSGGTDSAFLLKAAHDALGERCIGVTAASPSLAREELDGAIATARGIGARHLVIETREIEDPRYRENTSIRCYYCKGDLFGRLAAYAEENGYAVVVDGTNADDVGDIRPGRDAAREHGVRSPLLELGIGKREIRELSHALGLPTWNKPAAACLSSRVPHGTEVTVEVLSTIEKAEAAVRRHGIGQLRVRHHDKIARIEIEPDDFPKLIAHRGDIVRDLKALGYDFVTFDLEGFRSGSLSGGKGREETR